MEMSESPHHDKPTSGVFGFLLLHGVLKTVILYCLHRVGISLDQCRFYMMFKTTNIILSAFVFF